MQGFPQGAALTAQVALALGWVLGYVLWSRWYFRRLDPRLRARLDRRAGGRVVWTYRRGGTSGGTLSFRLPVCTWSWGIDDADRSSLRGALRDGTVYALYVVTVPVLAGLWPVAVLSVVVFATRLLHPLVAYPLFFVVIPVYARYWSGRYEVRGMRESRTPGAV
jgi:hypothetical protein